MIKTKMRSKKMISETKIIGLGMMKIRKIIKGKKNLMVIQKVTVR